MQGKVIMKLTSFIIGDIVGATGRAMFKNISHNYEKNITLTLLLLMVKIALAR